LHAEGFTKFPSINYPGTVREHATVVLDRTGNRKEGSVYFAMPTMVFQKSSYTVGKSREPSHIKALD
jgi:hypothetical protein